MNKMAIRLLIVCIAHVLIFDVVRRKLCSVKCKWEIPDSWYCTIVANCLIFIIAGASNNKVHRSDE